MSGVEFDVVVAADSERGISRDGDLPWHLPGDLKHFATITRTARAPDLVNAVIMGRATWDSIPPRFRPLAGRRNIVMSRREGLALPDGVDRAGSLADALARAAGPGIDRVFVVGGGQVYAEALALPGCNQIYYTRIDRAFGCDTFFPAFEDRFSLAEVLAEAREGDIAYRIERWTR